MGETKRRPRRKVLHSVDQFYSFCELKDVVYTDMHVWRDEDGTTEPGKATLEANYSTTADEDGLIVSLRVLLGSEHWRYQVGLVVLYDGQGRFRVQDDVMEHILNRSTVVTALPFLRAAVMDLSSRVRDLPTPVLPLAGPATGRYLIRNEDIGSPVTPEP